MPKKISLCLIVKNNKKEIEHAVEAIQSCEKYVDEVCVTLTDNNDKLKAIPKSLKKYKVSYFKWEKDFAKARSYNFKQAKGDWIVWMDADDVFKYPENLPALVEEGEQLGIDAYWFNYWYMIDDYGNPLEIHPKLQMIRNDGHAEWRGRIHENLSPKRRSVRWIITDKVIRIHKYGAKDAIKKHQRNLEIMMEEIEKAGDNPDPRDLIYASKALLALNKPDEAEPFLLKFIQLSGWNEEIYEAFMLLGELYRGKKDWEHAKIAYLKAIELLPEKPDAYYGLAYAYNGEENFDKAIAWMETGLTKPIPKRPLVTYWADLTWKPLGSYAYMLLQKGRIDEALNSVKKAQTIHPQDEYLQITRELIEEAKTKRDIAKNIREIGKYLVKQYEEWKLPALFAAVPKAVEDNPMVLAVKNQYTKSRKWKKNEIAIYCPKTVEEWAPPSIDKGGIGGSETAVIELSKRLAKLGWKVTVFNWCSTMAGEYDGVIYKNFWEINWKDHFNILILWRYPDILDADIKADFIGIDMHDVGDPNDFIERRLNKIDKIFVKTKAHRTLYPEIPDEKFAIINNGIDLERFNQEVKRNPYKLVYSSTVDRGLGVLMDLFPRIKKEIPEAELHLYYGFKTFEALEKDNPAQMRFFRSLKEKIENTEGVVNHGRLGQRELAKEFLSAGIWVYPTAFYEISCITAMEAQAGGCIPVTSYYAALKETVINGIMIEGENDSKKYQDKWVEAVVNILKNPENYKEYRRKTIEEAKQFSWDNTAQLWDKELKKSIKYGKSKQEKN
ncbi:MAG: glycosyltransferase [Elusimicrobiota bacterium]